MIRIDSIWKEFPDKQLFKSLTLTIKSGMRIGLVGANGTGKTTLLRMILNMESPDAGLITTDKNQRLGYLPQDIVAGSGKVHSTRSVIHVAGSERFGRGYLSIVACGCRRP